MTERAVARSVFKKLKLCAFDFDKLKKLHLTETEISCYNRYYGKKIGYIK